MNEKIVKKLEQFPSATPSRWRKKAEERRGDISLPHWNRPFTSITTQTIWPTIGASGFARVISNTMTKDLIYHDGWMLSINI